MFRLEKTGYRKLYLCLTWLAGSTWPNWPLCLASLCFFPFFLDHKKEAEMIRLGTSPLICNRIREDVEAQPS
jgi:hypothetical protein